MKNYRQKFGKIALISGGIVLILLFFGTILLRFHFRDEGITLPWVNAFLTALVLLLGGYSDVFNPSPDEETPNWLRFFSIASTIAGTIFVGIIYALLTETLLASRFEFLKKRPPIPEKDHVVVIGLGKMGQEVASLLEDFRQPLVGVSFNTDLDRTILPKMPLIVGKEEEVLAQANLEKAKSVVITTDDDIVNLEIALMSRKINAKCPLVIRASGQALGEALPNILPNANVVNPYLVSAAAFAGAAFGENIIDIFQFNQQTILVTEYDVEAGDTLNGLLVSEVAYGYGVVPLLLQKPPESSKLMPSDDLSLTVGDRLIVLATTDGLQRIEKGRTAITPKKWRIRVDSAASQEAIFEGGNALMLISGCPPAQARELMQNLPGILPTPLYKPQAERLVRALSKARVQAELLSL